MRKIVVYELLSLDGVAEACDQFVTEWDDTMDANLGDVIGSQDAVILGRRSFDEWSEYWSVSDIQPFSDFINNVEKHVATSSALDGPWANSHVIDGDLVEYARTLKQTDGGDIGVHASIRVAQALLAGGVVDELRVVIAPKNHSVGRRLLEGLPPIQLELASGAVSPTGYLLANYRVAQGR